MNIFFLDMDPTAAAIAQCNEHVQKMATECAQILSNIHWRMEQYHGPNHVENGDGPFRETSMAAPTLAPMQWVGESLADYRWALEYGLALCDEFESRREPGRPQFGTRYVMEWLWDHQPRCLPDCPLTAFKTATVKGHEDLFDVRGDPVATARRYYAFAVLCIWNNRRGDFVEGAWPAGKKPAWIEATRRSVPAVLRREILEVLKARKKRPPRAGT